MQIEIDSIKKKIQVNIKRKERNENRIHHIYHYRFFDCKHVLRR